MTLPFVIYGSETIKHDRLLIQNKTPNNALACSVDETKNDLIALLPQQVSFYLIETISGELKFGSVEH